MVKMLQYYAIFIWIAFFLCGDTAQALNCTKPNEEFKCGPPLPATCFGGETVSSDLPSCVDACFCKPGFLRNKKGICISETLCKCKAKFELTEVFPDDKFIGNEKAYVACILQTPGGIHAPILYFQWLEDKKTKELVTVTGEWLDYECAPAQIKPFHVSSETYNQTLNKCKELGYHTAQPGIPNIWSPFAVGNVATDYYYRHGSDGGVRYDGLKLLTKCCPLEKDDGIVMPSPNLTANSSTLSKVKIVLESLALPEDNFSGDDKTYVFCVKQKPDDNETPQMEWLTEYDANAPAIGKLVPVMGQWVNHSCSEGKVESFHVSTSTYKNVLKKCLEKGFDAAQPSHIRFGNLFPFQVGNHLTDYFSYGLFRWKPFSRIPATPLPTCTGV